MKKFFSIRKILTLGLLLSCLWTGVCAYYKVRYWGFSLRPKATTKIWNIEAHIRFTPSKEPIEISFGIPQESAEYKILNEDISAKGYHVSKSSDGKRLNMKAAPQKKVQDIYYRLKVYDNEDSRGKLLDTEKPKVIKPIYDEQTKQQVEDIWQAAQAFEGRLPQKIIALFNKQPLDASLNAFLPVELNEKQRVEKLIELLAYKNVPARMARGVRLEESKQESFPDLMLEAFDGDKWRLYDIYTGVDGLPKNFMIFQRGGKSLLDVSGGIDSRVKFSAIKSSTSTFKMAKHRAEVNNLQTSYQYSIYSLPLLAQNSLKWLMIFPLGILITVLMRNVVGLSTMGTFTPMLIALSLVKTGFWAGLICFALILIFGLLLRLMLSKLNLLLVPRISAVVIFVILIIEGLTVIGYRLDMTIASSAVFFPIIITAWIIERASIIWEEEGPKNTIKEIIYSTITAMATYFVINSETIRHVMFAFNELNLVILFVVMLLGTYTGYRLTELKRFYSLAKDKK